jgi:peroxiredoxin Q/BCP
MEALRVGDRAPDVLLTTQDGGRFSLAGYWQEHVVVLFFYPKDHTPICTKEACAFRDSYQEFIEAGAAVVGVSGDSEASHQSFIAEQRLPYLLAADADGSVRRAFGVHKTIGLFPRRMTYVIDRNGVIRHIGSSQLSAHKHAADALQAVRAINSTADRC